MKTVTRATQQSARPQGGIDPRFDRSANAATWSPLWPIPAALPFLRKRATDVFKLIESGQLAWAFNIAAKVGRQATHRIFKWSILEYAGYKQPGITPTASLKFAQVAELIIDWPGETLSGVTIQRILFCGADHIRRLLEVRELVRVTDPKYRQSASPRITRASLISFLERRRML